MTSCNLGNWNEACENQVNEQINLEFWASYQYDLMWSYFDRSSVGMKNIAAFFRKASDEEREHARKLMEYQNLRGGTVVLTQFPSVDLDFLKTPNPQTSTNDVLLSFQKALEMEQMVYQSLLKLHKVADENNDPQFADFVEGTYLEEQVEALNEMAKYVSQVQRINNDGHGLWNFDREFES